MRLTRQHRQTILRGDVPQGPGRALDFIQARKLPNRLVHEYVESRDELAANLNEANRASVELAATLERVAEALTGRRS